MRSTFPFLNTQVVPLKMQILTLFVGSLIPESSRPDFAPGLSPTNVVIILTFPSRNSAVHPSELSVESHVLQKIHNIFEAKNEIVWYNKKVKPSQMLILLIF